MASVPAEGAPGIAATPDRLPDVLRTGSPNAPAPGPVPQKVITRNWTRSAAAVAPNAQAVEWNTAGPGRPARSGCASGDQAQPSHQIDWIPRPGARVTTRPGYATERPTDGRACLPSRGPERNPCVRVDGPRGGGSLAPSLRQQAKSARERPPPAAGKESARRAAGSRERGPKPPRWARCVVAAHAAYVGCLAGFSPGHRQAAYGTEPRGCKGSLRSASGKPLHPREPVPLKAAR